MFLTTFNSNLNRNTTQAVKIDHSNITTKFLSDYKRRCYGTVLNDDDSESTEMAS